MSAPLSRVLMVQGTASSVGKSTIVTALCRLFARQGLRVAPFKAQNMALNSAVTATGGEIGRSTAVQAAAAGIEATVDMNPILVKPEADSVAQIIVHGRILTRLSAADYYADQERRRWLFDTVTHSLDRLRATHDLVIIEGAGSPVELNLRRTDLVNMAIARHADAPVLLVGDINPGGIFAALLGTLSLLAPEERSLVIGLVVNRFRGDRRLFADGVTILEERSGLPVLGVIPYLPHLGVPEEDSTAFDRPPDPTSGSTAIDVAVPRYPHVANFDDLDPLAAQPGVRVRFVEDAAHFGTPDLIVLPGSKTTVADLDWLRRSGLAATVLGLADAGTPVIGICGGYQMMGYVIHDPDGVESTAEAVAGLGLLPVETTFATTKSTHQVHGSVLPAAARGLLADAAGARLEGYEIHMGATTGRAGPLADLTRRDTGEAVIDGTVSWDGRRFGTYVHGLFGNTDLRASILASLGTQSPRKHATHAYSLDQALDRLADHVGSHLDVTHLRECVGLPASKS